MKYLYALPFFLLVGCSSSYMPVPDGYAGPRANIADSFTHHTGSRAHFFQLYKVNGHIIRNSAFFTMQVNRGRGRDMTPAMLDRDVPAAKQILTISGFVHYATDVQAMFGDSLEVTCDLEVIPVDGKKYVVKGEISSSVSTVWIEDGEGVLLGEKCSKKHQN